MNTLGTFINVSIWEYDKSFKSNVQKGVDCFSLCDWIFYIDFSLPGVRNIIITP